MKNFNWKKIGVYSLLFALAIIAYSAIQNTSPITAIADLDFNGLTAMAATPWLIIKTGTDGKDVEEFKSLSAEQLKKLSDEEHLQYATAREKHFSDQLNNMFSKYEKMKEKGDNIDAIVKELKEAQDNQNEAQKDILEAVGNLSKSIATQLKNAKNSSRPLTALDAIKDSLKEVMPELVKMKEGSSTGFMQIKVPGTITRPTNIIGADADRLPVPEYVPGLKLIPERNPFITEFLDVAGTSSATIIYTEEKNPDGDFAMTAEGTLKPLIDFDVEPATSTAKKNAGRIKVSDEMLEDIDFMAAEINRRLRKKHDLSLEDNILNGDGTGENFLGITTQAPAFNAGGLAAQVPTPVNADVIRAAINQIVVSSDSAYYPSAVFVHPDDAALMDLEKDAEGQYILPPFTSVDNTVIKGVRIYEKTKIPTGFFLVGDFMEANHRAYKPYSARVGWENDDFTKNLVTIIGESRTHFYIPSNCLTAFVYDQFSVAKAALLKP